MNLLCYHTDLCVVCWTYSIPLAESKDSKCSNTGPKIMQWAHRVTQGTVYLTVTVFLLYHHRLFSSCRSVFHPWYHIEHFCIDASVLILYSKLTLCNIKYEATHSLILTNENKTLDNRTHLTILVQKYHIYMLRLNLAVSLQYQFSCWNPETCIYEHEATVPRTHG